MLEEPFFEAVKNGWPDLMKAKAAFFSAIALVVTISAVATYGLCTHDIDSANQRATTAEQDRDLARNCRLVSSSQPKCPIDHIYKDHRIEVRTQEKIVPDPKQAAKIDQLLHDLKIALANNKPKPTPSDGCLLEMSRSTPTLVLQDSKTVEGWERSQWRAITLRRAVFQHFPIAKTSQRLERSPQ